MQNVGVKTWRNREMVYLLVVALVLLGLYFLFGKNSGERVLESAQASMFLCAEGKSVVALYPDGEDGEVRLRLSHSPRISLSQAVSASGEKYASADDKFTFWNKGAEATITENGKITYSDCQELLFAEEGTEPALLDSYTMAEVATHSTREDCWSVVKGSVYNLTEWVSAHPGGAGAIIQLCGKDGSDKFNTKHGGMKNPEAALATFKIGVLAE